MTDWEKRAGELAENTFKTSAFCEEQAKLILQLGREMAAEARNEEGAEWIKTLNQQEAHWKELQRHAADARAEEIAKAIERDVVFPYDQGPVVRACVVIARATIKKACTCGWAPSTTQHHRPGCPMAPEPGSIDNPLPYGTARKAGQCEKLPGEWPAYVGRTLWPDDDSCARNGWARGSRLDLFDGGFRIYSPPPKTREQVLEEALLSLLPPDGEPPRWMQGPNECWPLHRADIERAKRALEAK